MRACKEKFFYFFFFSSRRRHTRSLCDWSSDVCSSDLVSLVICNTMVKHEPASGEYNTRRAECEEGVRLLSGSLPGIRALRDVSLAELEAHAGTLPEIIYKRCRHVISEGARVTKAAATLDQGDLDTFG